MPAGLPVEVIS